MLIIVKSSNGMLITGNEVFLTQLHNVYTNMFGVNEYASKTSRLQMIFLDKTRLTVSEVNCISRKVIFGSDMFSTGAIFEIMP